ncbi:MAG: hypothetical protein ACI4OY_13755 [Aristaeellaceae bacterium]
MEDRMIALCVVAGGACWLLVYADAIRMGFRQKNSCVPLFPLGLNIAWEGIYACTNFIVRSEDGAQAANAAWLLLDLLMAGTWFRFGRQEAPEASGRKWYETWSAVALTCCLVVQVLMMADAGGAQAGGGSACLLGILSRDAGARAAACAAWLLLNVIIMVTCFRHGGRAVPGKRRRFPWHVLALACCPALLLVVTAMFGHAQGERYAAYLQHIAMSVACLYMLCHRRTRWQTALIGACKGGCTLTFIASGAMGGSRFMVATGIVCFALDGVCMVCLYAAKRRGWPGLMKQEVRS